MSHNKEIEFKIFFAAGAASQAMSLQDLGIDLVGGLTKNSADFFRPLTDVTRQAKSNLPRLGDVINK